MALSLFADVSISPLDIQIKTAVPPKSFLEFICSIQNLMARKIKLYYSILQIKKIQKKYIFQDQNFASCDYFR